MRLRLLALLAVAAVSGSIAGLIGSATAGKRAAFSAPFRPPPISASQRATLFRGPCPLPAAYRGFFVSAASETGLPLALLTALAIVESDFDAQAVSSAGAQGLLQVMPETARLFGLDPQEPRTNVLAGARYLRELLDDFHSTDLALAAYNAGPDAVEKAGGAPSADVAAYVGKVTRIWRRLNGCS
jgi:soluble lytic murein transglycosylase-like protein